MSPMFNIYCDESCHLENDGQPVMVLGALSCPTEQERTPDLERCARIPWIAPVIQNADDAASVRWWENERSSSRGLKIHVPLWLFEHDYAVILEKRPDFYLLITTYSLRSRQIERFEQEWNEWNGKNG